MTAEDDSLKREAVPALRARARGRRRADRWMAFLDGVSAVLEIAGSFDDTLRAAARLALPAFADLCIVALEQDGALKRTAVAHADPEKDEALARAAAKPDALDALREAAASGRTSIHDEPNDALSALGVRALLTAPLTARGRTLGAIAFGAAAPGTREFESSDLPVAVEAGRRIALAIDNARQLADAHRAALVAEARRTLAECADEPSILGRLCGIVVPRLADRCTLLLLDRDDALARATGTDDRRDGDEDLARAALADDQLAIELRGAGPSAARVAAPVATRGKATGVLVVASDATRALAPEDLPVCEEIARRLALALETARLHASEQAARARAETLVALTDAFARVRGPADVATVLARDCARALGAESGTLARFSRARRAFVPVVGDAAHTAEQEERAWRVVDAGTPQWMDDGREVWAPLVASGRAVGVARFTYESPRAAGAEDPELLAAVCGQCAQALDRAIAYEESRAASARLAYVAEANKALGRSLDVVTTASTLARLAVPELADGAAVDLLEDGRLRRVAAMHVDSERAARLLVRPPDASDPDFGPAVTVPLVAHGDPMGALILYGDRRHLGVHRAGLAEELARSAALAVENARLYQREQEARDAEREARALAEAAEARAEFLSRASAILGESLDVSASLPLVARMCTPLLADWCVFDAGPRAATGGGARHVFCAHVEPTREPLVRAVGAVPDVDARTSAGGASIDELFPDARSRDAVARLGASAFMIVPLAVAGRSLGALLLVRAEPGRTYAPVDVALARELARRVALALDHAHLYAQAREALSLRDRLTAVVMHDLRNPLSAIRLAAEVLLTSDLAGSARRNCESIRRCARHMSSIVEDLVEVSRMQSGRPSVDLRREPARALVAGVMELISPLAAAKHIELEAPLPDDALAVICDPRRVLQVLSNICGNAIKFTPERGRVAISCEAQGKNLRFAVKDTGPGISAEHQARVFEPFWRADEKSPGLGLGLAIAKGIVEAHGGTMEVSSDPGEGCTFAFTLPRA